MTNQLSKCANRYGIENSSEKIKVMVNSNESSLRIDITLMIINWKKSTIMLLSCNSVNRLLM